MKTFSLLHKSITELKNFDWYELTEWNTIGSWPVTIKYLLCLSVFMLFLLAGYWFHIRSLQATLRQLTEQEDVLQRKFSSSTELASNLDKYREKMREMEMSLDALLAQLPTEAEMAGLLEDISSAGVNRDLEFSSIQLQDEVEREFYIELPMTIKVSGGYHDIGHFVSGVASLSRIVTLHDFTLGKLGKVGNIGEELNMTVAARTYRYKHKND